MRGDKNFKGSDSSDPSVYFLFCDLKTLNNYVHSEKFKLESLGLVKSMLKTNDYLMKLDLTDAYYSVPIADDHKKYLRFQFQGVTYEYSVLLPTSSIHQLTEDSCCHSQIGRHSISDLPGRSSTTSSQCGRTTKSFPHCDNPSCGLGAHYQTREMLTSTNTSNYLSGDTAKFNQSDHCSPSREILPLAAGVQGNPDTTMLFHAGTLITVGSNESHCPDWDLGSTLTLSGSSTTVHCRSTQERPVHEIQEIPDLPVEERHIS